MPALRRLAVAGWMRDIAWRIPLTLPIPEPDTGLNLRPLEWPEPDPLRHIQSNPDTHRGALQQG